MDIDTLDGKIAHHLKESSVVWTKLDYLINLVSFRISPIVLNIHLLSKNLRNKHQLEYTINIPSLYLHQIS